ncbi:uncharacterized protein [Dysidea avara]|uniref:uncharacterized protein isoform X2 n=1 Tax=Dysidea avara TaxID=196820 RepID=UPI0033271B51
MSTCVPPPAEKSHKAKPARVWEQRLRRFAAGEQFGKGQKPAKGSRWDLAIQRIVACPAHENRREDCVCLYHQSHSLMAPSGSGSHVDEGVLDHVDNVSSVGCTTATTAASDRTTSIVPYSTSFPSIVVPWWQSSSVTITVTSSSNTIISTAPPLSSSTTTLSSPSHPHLQPNQTGSSSQQHLIPTSFSFSSYSGSSITTTLSADLTHVHSPTTLVATTVESTLSLVSVGPSTAGQSDNSTPPPPENFIPDGWLTTMATGDQQWISEAMFVAKDRVSDDAASTLWWYPPTVRTSTTEQPQPENYMLHRFFLWMPRRAWGVDFKCPRCCQRSFISSGLYDVVRSVVDFKDYYFIATEQLRCMDCDVRFPSWDPLLLNQLTDRQAVQFPAILTRSHACDKSVVVLLRSHGSNPTALHNTLLELHCEEWLKKQSMYLDDCRLYSERMTRLWSPPVFARPLPFVPIPSARWLVKVFVQDILSRKCEILATCTSIFGSVLKLDITKKVCGKLGGRAAGVASFCTNVGNEKGEVLISVVTDSVGLDSLRPMAIGLAQRYARARQDPPLVLYITRDCCNTSGISVYTQLFVEWSLLQVRLDVWQFMRRLACGCTSPSHPLYGTFMSRLSKAIFEWDERDYRRLCDAKRGCLQQEGMCNPPMSAIEAAITKEELKCHCRRGTRGAQSTEHLISNLLQELGTATNTSDVPVFSSEMATIWDHERRHVPCIQDPPGVSLYTVTGYTTKGGVQLPMFHCSRGVSSLQSFNIHLEQFIPGSLGCDVHFQAYLLEGLSRFNQARRPAPATQLHSRMEIRTHNLHLVSKVNQLSQTLFGSRLLPHLNQPSHTHEEYFGLEYLYKQTEGLSLSLEEGEEDDDDANSVDGFVDKSTDTLPSDYLMTIGVGVCEEEERRDRSDTQQHQAVSSTTITVTPSSALSTITPSSALSATATPSSALSTITSSSALSTITPSSALSTITPMTNSTLCTQGHSQQAVTVSLPLAITTITTATNSSLPHCVLVQRLDRDIAGTTPRRMSKTTEWRHRKRRQEAAAAGLNILPSPQHPRRDYSCSRCGQVISMDSNHKQYYGARYCPNDPDQGPFDEWLERRKEQFRQQQQQQLLPPPELVPISSDRQVTVVPAISPPPSSQ